MKYNDYIAVHIIRKIKMKEEKSMRNKRKTMKRRIILVLLVALVAVRLLHFQVLAADGDDAVPSVICMDGESLLSALDAASDGDIIGISGNIIVTTTNDRNIGDDARRITIKRMTADACITFQNTNGTSIFLRNIIFDGGGISKQCNPLVTVDVKMEVWFTGVTFQNCNTELQGAAVNIISGSVNTENCLFLNNHAESGGHIAMTNKSNLLMNNSTLINGQADKNGGAIYIAASDASLIMRDCTITDNNATWGGGIFYNGMTTLNGCVIYDNKATVGGADILNNSSTDTIPCEDIADMVVNYAAVKIIPLEWVNDYNGGELPENVDVSKSNTFMKMSYNLMETEETEPDDSGEETPPETEEPENPEETETPEEPENSEESDNQEETEPPENPDDSTESEDTNNTDDTENTQNPEADNSENEQTNTSTDENNNDSSITTENEPTENISDTSKETTADNITSNTTVNIQNIPDKSNTENEPQTVNNDNSQPLKVTTVEIPMQTAGENKCQEVQQQNNIRIEANGVNFTFEMADDNISIVADKEEQLEPIEPVIKVQESFNNDTVEQEEPKKGIDWFQLIQTILLAAILFCILPMSKNGKVGLENRHVE